MIHREIRSDVDPTVSPAVADTVPPRLVVFGLRCDFTGIVVEHCSRRGVEVAALLVPGPPALADPVRVTGSPRVLPIAGTTSRIPDVPTFLIGSAGAPSTRSLIASFDPDIIAVACFPARIPSHTTRLARLAAVNVHPSRLPEGRGPDPLFWTLRRGDGRAAVSVHALGARLDAGPIYAQREVDYPDGTSETVLDATLAAIGGELLAETSYALVAGTANAVPQEERLATYEPWPTARDYVIDSGWSARAAYNFIRGVAARPDPVFIVTADGPIVVATANHYVDRRPAATSDDGGHWVRFSDGWLRVRVHDSDSADGMLRGQ